MTTGTGGELGVRLETDGTIGNIAHVSRRRRIARGLSWSPSSPSVTYFQMLQRELDKREYQY